MKITVFIGGLSGGGAERVACNLSNYLADSGNDVDILTMSDDEPDYTLLDKVSRHSLLREYERKNFIYNNILRMYRLFKYMRKQTDVDAYVVMLPTTIIMLMLLRFVTKSKIIISERNNPADYSPRLQYILKHFSKKADGIVFQTHPVRDWYKSCLKKAKSAVIYNAINPVFLKEKYSGEREKEIVGVGRLSEQKNFPLLIKSFASVVEQYPDYKLVIYGKGHLLENLKSLTKQLSVDDKVEFRGHVRNIHEELEKAALFVMPSDYEGMPNALIEAMALGLPCVSTKCGGGGAEALIQHGENGLLVDVDNEQQMTDAIKKVLSDTQLAEKMGSNASKICDTLAPDKIYGQWETFISSIVNGGE